MTKVQAAPERRRYSSRRFGEVYQDIVGISYLLRMFDEDEAIEAVEFENEDGKSLDDVTVFCADKTTWIQVKYAVEPDQEWTIKNLSEPMKKGGTSLLRKWAISWQTIKAAGKPYEIIVRTNRIASTELAPLVERTGSAVHKLKVDDTNIIPLVDATGLSKDEFRQFASDLQLHLGQPMLEELTREVKQGFKSLGTTDDGWNSLLAEAGKWVMYKSPRDGLIRIGDVRVAAQLWDPSTAGFSQEFQGDAVVHIRNSQLERAYFDLLANTNSACVCLEGPPGSGKSSFLSSFADRIATKEQTKRHREIGRAHV